MLRLLRRILGWDADSGPFDFEGLEPTARPSSRTASVRSGPKPVQRAAQPPKASIGEKQPADPAKPTRPPKEKTASEILDNPELSLNGPQDEGFDPYNTGAFNRSSSWERIAKHRSNR